MSLTPLLTNSGPNTSLYAPASGGGGGGGASTIGPNLTLSSLTMNSAEDGITFNFIPNAGAGDVYFYGDVAQSTFTSFGLRLASAYVNPATGGGDVLAPVYVGGVQQYGPIGGSEIVVLGNNAGTSNVVPKITAGTNSDMLIRAAASVNVSTGSFLVNGAPAVLQSQTATLSSLTASTLVTNFGLASSFLVENGDVKNLNITQQDFVGSTFYAGGITFPKFGAGENYTVSLLDPNKQAITTNRDYDADANSTFSVGFVEAGSGPSGPYNQPTTVTVGTLLVAGPGSGTGNDIFVAGPKPYITATQAGPDAWAGPFPPSAAGFAGPTLDCSPIQTNFLTADTARFGNIIGAAVNSTLGISQNNLAYSLTSPPCLRLNTFTQNPGVGVVSCFSTFVDIGTGQLGADISIATAALEGNLVMQSDSYLMTAVSSASTGLYMVNQDATDLWNNGGVNIGISFPPTDLQITGPNLVSIPGNLSVSTINNAQPKDVAALFSTLFGANPTLSTIPI